MYIQYSHRQKPPHQMVNVVFLHTHASVHATGLRLLVIRALPGRFRLLVPQLLDRYEWAGLFRAGTGAALLASLVLLRMRPERRPLAKPAALRGGIGKPDAPPGASPTGKPKAE